MENLVVKAYNGMTYEEEQGCVNQYLWEMLNATLVDQSFTPAIENSTIANSMSVLEMVFNAWVACKDCLVEEPLFWMNSNVCQLQQLDASEFFQEFIATVNVEIKNLVEEEELESGFVQIAVGYVEDEKEETSTTYCVNTKDLVLIAEVRGASSFGPYEPKQSYLSCYTCLTSSFRSNKPEQPNQSFESSSVANNITNNDNTILPSNKFAKTASIQSK
jgi:hypothetical protein